MSQERIDIPNTFTRGPLYHVTMTRDDGTKEYWVMTEYELQEWLGEDGGEYEES